MRTIGPDTEHRYVFWARPANEPGAQEAIYRQRKQQWGAPPPGVAGSGRMNAAGISVFDGSFDAEDARCRAAGTPVGGYAIVGRFEVLRPLRILDLTLLDNYRQTVNASTPHYSERMAYAAFNAVFSIRKSVGRSSPGREALDYLPTQVIAEYLWSQDQNPIDGLVFGSAQITGSLSTLSCSACRLG